MLPPREQLLGSQGLSHNSSFQRVSESTPSRKYSLHSSSFDVLILNRPGVIYTPIQADTRDPEGMKNLGENKALGRPGQASEVATSFVFLASRDASFYCMCHYHHENT